MRILVTGSAGFLASWLIPFLQANGHFIVGLDREFESRSDEFIRHDLLNEFCLRPINFDICLHLASSVGGFLFNSSHQGLLTTEIKILKNLHKICKASNVERIIFTSSINVFEMSGIGAEEPLGANIPLTPYARAKADVEDYIASEFKFFSILRPTNFFGADQPRLSGPVGRSHVIPDLLYKIKHEKVVEVLGDGKQIRNFIHLSDVSKLILILLENPMSPRYINLRSEIFLTIDQLVIDLMRSVGVQKQLVYRPKYLKFEPAPITSFRMKNAEMLGWKSDVQDLLEGLQMRQVPAELHKVRAVGFHP